MAMHILCSFVCAGGVWGVPFADVDAADLILLQQQAELFEEDHLGREQDCVNGDTKCTDAVEAVGTEVSAQDNKFEKVGDQVDYLGDEQECIKSITAMMDAMKADCIPGDTRCTEAVDALGKPEFPADALNALVERSAHWTEGRTPMFWVGFAGAKVLAPGKGNWDDLQKVADMGGTTTCGEARWTDVNLFPKKNDAWDIMYDTCTQDYYNEQRRYLPQHWTEVVRAVADREYFSKVPEPAITVASNGDCERLDNSLFLKPLDQGGELNFLKSELEKAGKKLLIKVLYTTGTCDPDKVQEKIKLRAPDAQVTKQQIDLAKEGCVLVQ